MIEEASLRILDNILPEEWVKRRFTPDYGIDLDIELFDYEEKSCISLGEHLFVQLKGTEHIKCVTASIKEHPDFVEKGDIQHVNKRKVISFSIETALLSLVERMGSAVPVLLIVVDVGNSKGYFVCLNDYIEKVIIQNGINYNNQKELTIHIPLENELNEESIQVLRMYAKRAKLSALLNTLHAKAQNMLYIADDDLVHQTYNFFQSIKDCDAWNARKYLNTIELTKSNIDYFLVHRGLLKFCIDSIERHRRLGGDPEKDIVYFGLTEIPVTFVNAQKIISCKHLWEEVKNLGCILEDDTRALFLPTYLHLLYTDQWEG
ncbi:DUF4365 domain-containing protein [Clostridium estertheticum]|uniref:DUF4365 domain-containing protein n=1 Tax=Clostridium estertheticum TaxID=238834 RepID=UPI001CD15266|nr:DUF4365 domain-containing protein [Clostridium estertheticum]MBZ9686813.1 DUF4365 domain-containing protein [Clostridium estertheticum]